MILYVYLQGGLGNQMFQYAAGLSALKEYPQFTNLRLDASFYNDQERKVINNGLTGRGYDLDLFNIKYNVVEEASEGSIMLKGFFQNINEFQNVVDEVKDQFTFSINFSDKIKDKELFIKNNSKNSVSIHVRRGDFINNPTAYAYNEHMDSNYYQKAMDIIESKYDDLTYYVFSEDIEWCQNNIKSDKYPIHYIGNDFSGERDSGHFYLMQKCNKHIIANSTYSWWAAFLSNSELTIGPKKWYKNEETCGTMLEEWIKI